MHLVLTLVGIVTVVIAVAGLCSKFDLPSPLVLIVVGVIGSYLPFIPDVELSPEVVLVGLLPPLLYAAALQTSLIDFNANRRSILLLSVGLVAFTTAGVGVLVPGCCPTSTGRRRSPSVRWWRRRTRSRPRPSLVGSACRDGSSPSSRASRCSTTPPRWSPPTPRSLPSAGVTWHGVAVDFLLAAVGGVLVGLLFFVVIGFVRKHVTDPVIDSALSFVTPFAAYVAAENERIHASGVISVVVAGLLLGHKSPILQTAQSRIAERMNWRSIAFLLESSVFLLIGLQARTIIGDAVGRTA